MKTQKNKLMLSAIALFLCFTMLVGTTFAWFTDSVTSDGNIIQTGSLKVDLSHKVGDGWVSIKQNPDHKIFDYDKWEPGYTRVETLKVQNLGSLALTYRLTMDVLTATAKLGPNGESLADVIDVYFVNGERTAASFDAIKSSADWTYKGTLSEVMGNAATILTGELLPEGEILAAGMPDTTKVGEETITIALHMQETAGNEYQDLSVGEINLNLIATQLGYEEDSFGAEYDVVAKDYILEDQAALDAALYAKKSLIILAPGEYTLPSKVKVENSKGQLVNKTVTYSGMQIIGMDGAKITSADYTNWTNVTVENVEFDFSLKIQFKGNSIIKNCTFNAEQNNAIRQAKVSAGATLTIENCVFNLNDIYKDGVTDTGALHFQGNENGTVIINGCTVNSGYLSFGRTMNVEINNCSFNGTNIGAYGDMTLTNCTFSPTTKLYINPKTGNTEVTMTLKGCSVVGGAPVSSVFVDYSGEFTHDIDWKVIIDDITLDKNSVFASQSIVAGEDGANFNLSFKGQAIASLSIPKDAIADLTKPVTVTFVSIDPADTITLEENVRSYAYDIDVTNLKSNPADRAPITVVLTVPNALAAANVYHNGELIENYSYNEVAGSVTFETTSFSPYAVSYTEYEVTTIEQLREYASMDNVNIKLMADLYVNLDPNAAVNNCDDKHFCKLTGSYEYYNGVNINGKNVAIDLNGNSIIVSGDKDADTVGAVFFIMPNSNLNINDSVGGGKIKLCDPAYIVWAPYDAEYGLSYVDVYGGIFMSHGYAGDERTPGRFAMFYAGEGGLIDIYGGYFLYENDDYTDKNGVVHPNNNNGFCNVMNSATTPCITIHDGAMLINSYYRQDGYVNNVKNWQADHDSIFLAENTELVETTKSVTIDGVTYDTWYQVKCNHTGGKATCTTQATCDYCGKYYGEILEHNYIPTVTPPTCTDVGYTTYTCGCGKTYTANEVPATGHSLYWASDNESYCYQKCYNCSHSQGTTSHTWTKGMCSRCNKTQTMIANISDRMIAKGIDREAVTFTFLGGSKDASEYTAYLLYNGSPFLSSSVTNGGTVEFNMTNWVVSNYLIIIVDNSNGNWVAQEEIQIVDPGVNKFWSASTINSKGILNNGLGGSATKSMVDGYVRLYCNTPNNEGQLRLTMLDGSTNFKFGYMVIKYRKNVYYNGVQVYPVRNNALVGIGDMWISDNQTGEICITKNYYYNGNIDYIMLDFFTKGISSGHYIDIEYIAFVNDPTHIG